jgi:dTDP-glucose pyrophosphorylase
MKPTLVILAAGMGSRYGGVKQLEPVGPAGETIMDYSMYDAIRAGFGKAVFVIRDDMKAAFEETIGRRYERHIPVACAFQRLEELPAGHRVPPGREKPWGTGHAVLMVADRVHEPFAVVNADDFYGADSFATLGRFLGDEDSGDVPAYAMVGYTLRDTLAEAGSVNRGCCRCSATGWLEEITEIINIEPHGSDARYFDESGEAQFLSGDQLVSMNTWGFQPVFFDQLRECFESFLQENASSQTTEFYLPTAVQKLMHAGRARVKVLPTTDKWCGVTHVADKARVVKMIRGLVDQGVYPAKLWE